MIGVRNFEGIDGALTLIRPGLTAAARKRGDCCWEGALMIGPLTLVERSKTLRAASYLQGPT